MLQRWGADIFWTLTWFFHSVKVFFILLILCIFIYSSNKIQGLWLRAAQKYRVWEYWTKIPFFSWIKEICLSLSSFLSRFVPLHGSTWGRCQDNTHKPFSVGNIHSWWCQPYITNNADMEIYAIYFILQCDNRCHINRRHLRVSTSQTHITGERKGILFLLLEYILFKWYP